MTSTYIGITGFTNQQEISELFASCPPRHKLMAGVLVSDKTFAGTPNKYPHRYPTVDIIPSIWHEQAFNVLHYCTEDPRLPIMPEVLERCEISSGMGVQLNVTWPDPAQLQFIKRMDIKIILQIGSKCLVGLTQSGLCAKLAEYAGLYDYLLLDMSGGRGIPIDHRHIAYLVYIIRHSAPAGSIALTGGLSANNLHELAQHKIGGSRFSIDAESGLRDPEDRLVPSQCRAYLAAANELLDW